MSGVYGISNAREWIYIGETDNIQSSLLNHLHEINTKLTKRGAHRVCFRGLRPGAPGVAAGQLVSEYGPACNRQAQHS